MWIFVHILSSSNDMKLENGIKERRSIRKYSESEVTEDTIREILDLSRFSPSWKNTQVVRYHIIKNRDMKEKIAENCVLSFDFNAKTIVRSNALVIISVVKGTSGYEKDGSFSTSQQDRWEMFDAGIATQTFCLAAHSKGVGSVILGVFDEEKIRQYIDIPENERVTNLIAIGYPLDQPKSAPPRKSVDEISSFVL